jgi:hypothetical protein
MAARPVVAVKPREHELSGGAAEPHRILGHDAEARVEGIGQQDVVEADHRQLVLEAERVDRAHGADRDQVLAREERRGRITAAEELACGLIRVDAPKPRMPDQVKILSQAVLREGLAVPPQTLGSGEHLRAVAEEADPAVARRDQVLDRRARTPRVVGHDRVGVEERGRAVDEGECDAGGALALQVGAVLHRAGDDQPVDPARAERLGELALALGLLVGAADERQHAPLARRVLDAAVDRPEERIGHVLEDESDARRLPIRAAQGARREVVPVAQQLDGVAHALGEVAAHALAAVDHPRDRAEADAGNGRHLAHRRPAPRPARRGLHPHAARYYASKKTIARVDVVLPWQYGSGS